MPQESKIVDDKAENLNIARQQALRDKIKESDFIEKRIKPKLDAIID